MRALQLFVTIGAATGLLAWPLVVNHGLVARRTSLLAAGGVVLVAAGALASDDLTGPVNLLMAALVWALAAFLTRQPSARYPSTLTRLFNRCVPVVTWAAGIVVALSVLATNPAKELPRAVSLVATVAGWQLVARMFMPPRQCRGCRRPFDTGYRLLSRSETEAFFCRRCWNYSCRSCLKFDRFRGYCAACQRAAILERMGRTRRPRLFMPAGRWAFDRLNEDAWNQRKLW